MLTEKFSFRVRVQLSKTSESREAACEQESGRRAWQVVVVVVDASSEQWDRRFSTNAQATLDGTARWYARRWTAPRGGTHGETTRNASRKWISGILMKRTTRNRFRCRRRANACTMDTTVKRYFIRTIGTSLCQ